MGLKLFSREWWHYPPNKDDAFFVHIREAFQTFFSCKHTWVHKRDICHGEDHGEEVGKRHCAICGKKQYQVYHKFGNTRLEWKNYPDYMGREKLRTNSKIVVLDFEGTLIKDSLDPIPRPNLYNFLSTLDECMFRVCIMTTISEEKFREIAKDLNDKAYVPDWFVDIEYVKWQRPKKDLKYVKDAKVSECVLVDDYAGYICRDQMANWLPIETYFDQGADDIELTRILNKLLTGYYNLTS